MNCFTWVPVRWRLASTAKPVGEQWNDIETSAPDPHVSGPVPHAVGPDVYGLSTMAMNHHQSLRALYGGAPAFSMEHELTYERSFDEDAAAV